MADGDDGFADEVEDFEAGPFKEAAEGAGSEHRELESLSLVAGEPVGFAGVDEFFQGVEIAAFDEMIEGGEFVVGGGDDDAAGLADAVHLA